MQHLGDIGAHCHELIYLKIVIWLELGSRSFMEWHVWVPCAKVAK